MPAKQGISGQIKEFDNNDKSSIHLPRQHLSQHHGGIRHDPLSKTKTSKPLI